MLQSVTVNLYMHMIRKLILVFLLFIGFQSVSNAQLRDSVRIYIPPYTDTTCVGTQLKFTAVQSDTSFHPVSYHWYVNNVFTGITLDTFYTTALNDGDSVYCWLTFTNSFALADSSRSNGITIHHLPSIPPRVLTSLIVGSNPDCAGSPLTFEAYPICGGITPKYQWLVNNVELPGEDSMRVTRVFGGADTVTCRMISDASCRSYDTAYSIPVPIIHIHLTAAISISAVFDSICLGGRDTFRSVATGFGNNISYQWYIQGVPVLGANGYDFITTALNDSDSVYVVLTTTDTCVLNPVVTSNVIYTKVKHVFNNYATIALTAGTNPGCLSDPVTFTAVFDSFGTAPYYAWYINGTLTSVGASTLSGLFANTDVVTLEVRQTDGGCYVHDTILVPGVVMVRDTTPVAPIITLIGDNLSTYSSGTMTWYFSTVSTPGSGTIIPGATDTFYHPTALGYYYIVANNVNCPSLQSNVIYISLLDVADINRSNANIYPNPTTGIVSLDWNNLLVNMTLNVYNALGQNVITRSINNNSHADIDLSKLPNGNYYLQLRDESGQYSSHKIILEHN